MMNLTMDGDRILHFKAMAPPSETRVLASLREAPFRDIPLMDSNLSPGFKRPSLELEK